MKKPLSFGWIGQVPLRTLLLIALVWGLIVSDVIDERRGLIGETTARNDAIASTLALQTAETVLQVDHMLAGLARDIADLPDEGLSFSPRLHDMLARRAASEPGIASIFITDEYGIVRHSSHEPMSPGADQSTREWYIGPAASAEERTFIAATIRLRLSNNDIEPGYVMSRRLGRGAETFNGVIAATVPTVNLTSLYAKLLPGDGQTIALWRDDGSLMAEWPGRHGDYPQHETQEIRPQPIGDGLVVDMVTGREVVRASEAVPGFPLHVVVSTELVPLLAERWDRVLYRGVAVASFTTLALCLAAWWSHSVQQRARRMRAKAQRAQDRLASVVDSLDELVWSFDPVRGELSILGRESQRHAVLRRKLEAAFGVNGAQSSGTQKPLREVDWSPQELVIEQKVPGPDGSIAWLLVRGHGVVDDRGRLIEVEGIAGDITARKAADAQFQHSRRLQALGQLTGGIAHDFNNLLGVVVGNLELMAKAANLAPAMSARLDSALTAAMRGADLTAKLLGFSHPSAERSQVIDCNDIVVTMRDLIAPVLPLSVGLNLELAAPPCLARVDAGGLQDALMNLGLNARDAMPDGGRLTIATRREHVEDPATLNLPVAGPYVIVTVRDTGTGMPPDVLERIFEPYFTTREHGRGTGLGLSQVFAFVRGAAGAVTAQSTPGHGATFELYLPAVDEPCDGEDDRDGEGGDGAEGPRPRGSETILLVDGEPAMLATMTQQLDLLGYHVIAAPDGPTAIELLGQPGVEIDLLLSDMAITPPIDGVAVARAARARHTDLPVILLGDTHGARLDWDTGLGPLPWLVDKPLRLGPLAHLIRSAL